VRKRKCKHCGDKYLPGNSLQQVCQLSCAIEYGKILEENQRQRDLRAAKRKLKPYGKWRAEAQASFNAFIRARDKHLPCITCLRFHEGQYDAGHYRGTGAAPELRFNELNVNRQCSPCNRHKSGDIVSYRLNLIEKIGLEAVESLEGPHEPKHYTIDDLQRIKREYRLKTKNLDTIQTSFGRD